MDQDKDNSKKEAIKGFLALGFFPFSVPFVLLAEKINEQKKKKKKPKPKMTWKQLRIFLLTTSIILAGMTACLFHFPWTS